MVAPPEIPRNAQPGKAKGQSPVRGSSDPMREAGAANRKKLLPRLRKSCAHPTGDGHDRTTDALAQRFIGAKLRATLEVG
jgi:hypothetical protein